jgi:hypothetical protein
MNYNQYNDAFSNGDYAELDKIARDINNKKKLYKDAKNNNKTFEKDTVKGISAYYGDPNFSFLPMDNHYHKNKGDFVSGLPTPLEDQSCSDTMSKSSISSDNLSSMYNLKNNGYSSDNLSSDDYSLMFTPSETDLSSGYSSLPRKTKKHLKLSTEHLKKYKDNDDKAFNHMMSCLECKQQLLNLLKENNHVFSHDTQNNTQRNTNNINTDINDKTNKDDTTLFGLNYKELRDIIILIMIGVIIIVFIDVFLRK